MRTRQCTGVARRAPKGFRSELYSIQTVEGLFSVTGYILQRNPHLAFRWVQHNASWTVDHIPSGLSLSQCAKLTFEQAQFLVLRLAGLDWSTEEKARKHGPEAYRVMDELLIDYGHGIRLRPGDTATIDLGKMKVGESITFRLG